MIYCTCKGRSFYQVRSWWVCAKCERPAKMYLESQMSQDGIELNLFQGGPHHNEIWSVEQLLLRDGELPSVASWITFYKWTNDTVTGSESSRVARVWEFDK